MSIDPYTTCFCGTGKKIKFCCPDLADDFDKIVKTLQEGQHIAALRVIDQLLKKPEFEDRASLMALRSLALRMAGQAEPALKHAEAFVEKHPENPTALSDLAMLTTQIKGDPLEAFKLLEKALKLSEQHVTESLYNAMGLVGWGLFLAHEWFAARWLIESQLALMNNDQNVQQMLAELCGADSIPAIMKDDRRVEDPSEDTPYKQEFDEAISLLNSGQATSFAARIEEMIEAYPDTPFLWEQLATARGMAARMADMVEPLRKLAALETDPDRAAYNELLALYCSTDTLGDEIALSRLTWTVKDTEVVQASMTLDRRTLQLQIPPQMRQEDQPPPRAMYMLLDRPMLDSGEGMKLEDIPIRMAQIMIFGRTTDSEARIEVIGLTEDEIEKAKTILTEIIGDELNDSPEVNELSRMSRVAYALSPQWNLPADSKAEQVTALQNAFIQTTLNETVTSIPLAVFDGKSLKEASGNESLRPRVLAVARYIETLISDNRLSIDFAGWRESLGLPVDEPVDPIGLEIQSTPPSILERIDIEKLTDEQLGEAVMGAQFFGLESLLYNLLRMLVDRPSFEGTPQQLQALQSLTRLAADPDIALGYLRRGRDLSTAAGQSCGVWDLLELTMMFSSGDVERARDLISHIQTQHQNEPEVMQAFVQLLVRLGIINPDGSPAQRPPNVDQLHAAAEPMGQGPFAGGQPPQPPQGGEGGGGIWTPGSPPPSSGGEGSGGGIWTPD